MPIKKIKAAQVKLRNWGKHDLLDPKDFNIKVDDWVIVETELGLEMGKVMNIISIDPKQLPDPPMAIARIADLEDLKKIKKYQEIKGETLKICKQYARKYDLPMKLVDCNYTFDDKKIIFAFTADSRVDFRDLVKDLINHFKKTVRLQQIGIRDELKQMRTIGPCGRATCCASFLDELGNITTDLARIQQIQQRGSDRLSGSCGRLKCCLNYEAEGYREGCKMLPAIDSTVKTEQGEGRVIDWNILKHSVTVQVDKDTRVEKFYGCRAAKCSGCIANKYYKKK